MNAADFERLKLTYQKQAEYYQMMIDVCLDNDDPHEQLETYKFRLQKTKLALQALCMPSAAVEVSEEELGRLAYDSVVGAYPPEVWSDWPIISKMPPIGMVRVSSQAQIAMNHFKAGYRAAEKARK